MTRNLLLLKPDTEASKQANKIENEENEESEESKQTNANEQPNRPQSTANNKRPPNISTGYQPTRQKHVNRKPSKQKTEK